MTDIEHQTSAAVTAEIRLIPVEIESLLLLYQKVNLLKDKLIKGEECLTLPNVTIRLLLKAHHVVENIYKGKPDPKKIPAEVKKLLSILTKVQFLGVVGYQRPPAHEDLANRTEEEAREEELARRCITVLDLRMFAHNLRTLHLKYMDVKRAVLGVADVVELILTDSTFDCSLKSFSSLRSINFDRCQLNPKHLATLSYSLRSMSVQQYQRNVDPPLWRAPNDDEIIEGMIPWEGLSYVAIRGSRSVFRMDPSWGDLTELRHLEITHVQLTTLKTMDILGRCSNLVSLDVSHNKLDNLQSLSTVGMGLVKLNMAYNRLSNVSGIANLPKLRELNLEGNELNSWVDIREIASGCVGLTRLIIKGNPITRQEPLTKDDVVPFCAAIFQFRSGLLVDGESTAGAKRIADPAFMSRFLPLFQTRMAYDDEGFDRRSAGFSAAGFSEGGHSRRSRSMSRRAQTMNIMADPHSSYSHRGSSRHRSRSHGKDALAGKKSKVVLMEGDFTVEEDHIPPEPSEIPENPEDAIFRRLNIAELKEKYGDKWQEQAVVLASSAYRDFQGIPEPLPDEKPRRKVSASPAGAEQPSHRRRKHKSRHHHADPSPDPLSPAGSLTSPAFTASNASLGTLGRNASSQRILSEEGERQTRAQMEKFREQLRQSAARAQTTISGIPRKEVEKKPSGTFAAFLDSVHGINWQVETEHGRRKNIFLGALAMQYSELCEENAEVWDMEDPTMYELGPGAVEVMLYDNANNPAEVRNRFENKTLIKLVEVSGANNRYIKLYAKVGPKTTKNSSITNSEKFGPRPIMDVVFGGLKDSTQPMDLGLEYLTADEAQRGGGVMSASRRTFFQSGKDMDSKREFGGDDFVVESGGAAERQMFRMTKPKILACFVVPTGIITQKFVAHIKSHLKATHSRLCVSGITHVWPRTFTAGFKGDDEPLKVKMDTNYVKDKCVSRHKELNLTRQRVGADLAVKGEDLFLNLQTYVFDAKLIAKDLVRLMAYTNIVEEAQDTNTGREMEWEQSILLIVTNTNVLLADDKNDKKILPSVKNPAEYFPDCRHQPLSCLTDIEVDYDLQAIKLDFGGDLIVKLKTRDRGITLGIIGAIYGTQPGKSAELKIRPCRVPSIINVPIAFVVGIFLRPLGKKMKMVKDQRHYPLRETKEEMIPARLVLTASEIQLVRDPEMDLDRAEPYTEKEVKFYELARRPLNSLSKFRVAGPELFPLIFGFEFGEGTKKEVWAMCAQHPNAIAAIESQVKRQLPSIKVGEMTAKEHQN